MWKQVLIIDLIVAASAGLLLRLISMPQQQLDLTSKLRFLYFIGVHVLVIGQVIVLARMEGFHSKIVLNCLCCVLIVAAMTVCEAFVRHIEESPNYNYMKKGGGNQHLELIYLVIYFISYGCSIVNLVLATLYLIATEMLIQQQEEKLNSGIEQCLTSRGAKGPGGEGACSICLEEMGDSNGNCVEVKSCGHLFHRGCLVEWMLLNKTCPLCREDMFQVGKDQAEL